ncbi:hypothetical protein ACHAXT_006998 [Thalassiosira profunda]
MTSKGTDGADRRAGGNANSTRQILWLFAWICAYRLANAWMIRTQFDPDEYWQTLEPAYCLVFGATGGDYAPNNATAHRDEQRMHGCALTWEWTRRWTPSKSPDDLRSAVSIPQRVTVAAKTMVEQALQGPVRSYVSLLPTYWYYLCCRSMFRWANAAKDHTIFITRLKPFIRRNATYLVSKGPALLHAILVAAPTDLSVWLIASRMNNLQYLATAGARSRNGGHNRRSWPFWALACSITSWFHGYALVRTYANSVETACLAAGIALLGPELFGQSTKDESSRQRGHGLRAKLAFALGGLSACVRFTSLAAWIPVGLIVSVRSGMGGTKEATTCNYERTLRTLFGTCATYGFIGVVVGCCIDRCFYGFWAVPFLGNIHFNVLLGHGSLYGTHPLFWYIYAGIPAICGALLPFFLWDLATMKVDLARPRNNPRLILLCIIGPYIMLHSMSEHKEFRFLLPILPLICILAGHTLARLASGAKKTTINTARRTSVLLAGLIVLNYPHLLYLAIVHQRGPVAVNGHLTSLIGKVDHEWSRRNVGITRQYTVHYLIGCHSAPVYSHLHISSVRVNTWHLDCSPDCRSNPNVVCESDAFSNDPYGFVTSAYGIAGEESCTEAGNIKEPPTFVVVMQDHAEAVDQVLTRELKMSHAGSVRHAVKSISWHTPDSCSSDGRCHDVVTSFTSIDVHFDHMEIYYRAS